MHKIPSVCLTCFRHIFRLSGNALPGISEGAVARYLLKICSSCHGLYKERSQLAVCIETHSKQNSLELKFAGAVQPAAMVALDDANMVQIDPLLRPRMAETCQSP